MAEPLATLRLEQQYRTDTGAENGSFILRIHHLGGATLTPEKLCCAIQFPPAADTRVTGGQLIHRFANHFQFAPPEGLNLAPGEVWQLEIHKLAVPPTCRSQGVAAAWIESPEGLCGIDIGDLQPPEDARRGAPKDWPEGRLELPLGLLPWPASVEVAETGPAPLLYPASPGLNPEIARIAALHRRLFPTAPAPFSLDPAPDGRAIEATEAALPPGGYRLDFAGTITLAHTDADGLRHGLIALAQMAHAARSDPRFRFPASGRITDAPRHDWRGLMLDVSRNFIGTAGIARTLDILAWHRMNRLHWHLTDDTGWRVPIPGLPALTETGGRRGHGLAIDPQFYDGPGGQSGAYGEAEIHALVAHGQSLGIEIMPEVDMPGHMTALLAALPELRDPDEPANSYHSIQGYPNNALNPGVDAIWPVLETIFDGLTALFPYEFIHIGGDEVAPESWAASPAAQALVAREELAPGAEALQAHFTRRVARMLHDRGRRLAGWDECAEGGGADNSALLFAWRTRERTAQLIAKGYDVICTPGQRYYLDMTDTHGWDAAGASWAGVSTPQDTYLWDAAEGLPEGPPDTPGRLIGLQACMWTEFVDTFARFNALAFPRLSAVAEAAWSPAKVRDWPRFAALSRLMPQL